MEDSEQRASMVLISGIYEMVIFLGATSGKDLGNVTVRTPSCIEALISSS